VGAFYTRFRDKDALLPALYERYDQSLEPALADLRSELERADAGLEEVARAIARHFVRMYRERRHLMAALAIYVRRHPGGVDARQRVRRERQHRFLVRALAARASGTGHEDAERAAELALYFAVTAIRDAVLFRESTHAASVRASDAELERETARMMLGYLTARP
jgi:AcrR family transcriptional regulator